jgi:hypothetical protein
MVSDLTPWELQAVAVDDYLLEGWCSSPWALRAAGGEAQDVPKRAAHHSSHSRRVERSVTGGSRDQARVCVVHGHQELALGGVVRAMPCWAGDSKSRLRRSRAAFVAIVVAGGSSAMMVVPIQDSTQQVLLQFECLLCEVHSGQLVSQMHGTAGASNIPQLEEVFCGSTRMVPAGRFAAVSRGMLTDACGLQGLRGGLRDGGGRAVVEDDSRAGQ